MSSPERNRHLTRMAYFLCGLGLVGVLAYLFVTPDFVSNYFTIDGKIDPNKIPVLDRMRSSTLVLSIVLFILSICLLFLSKKASNPIALLLQKKLDSFLNFDIHDCLQRTWKSIGLEAKQLFLINLLVIFFSHGFLLNNIIINWDGQGGLDFSSIAHLSSGRWMTALLGNLSEHHYLPLPFFVTTIVILAFAGVLFAEILGEKIFLSKALISAALVAFPGYAFGLSYNWVSPIYPIATLFALLAIKFSLKKGSYNLLKGLFFFVLMLATYQGLLSFTYCFMLMMVLINSSQKKISHQFIIQRFILLGLLAPIIYKLSSDSILHFLGMWYSDYRGADQMSTSYIFIHFAENFVKSYETLISFFDGVYFSMPLYQLGSILVLIGLAVFHLIFVPNKKSRWVTKIVIVTILLISPPFIFATQFLNTYIDSLLVFGFIPIIGVSFHIISRFRIRLITNIGVVLMALIILGFINRSNGIHLKNHLWTQTSLKMSSDIALRLAALPDFNLDTKLVRVGNLSLQKFPRNINAPFSEQGETMAAPTGLSTWGEARTLNGVMNFLGFDYQTALFQNTPLHVQSAVNEMPVYPEEGSIQIVDDYAIIKLSPKQ